jgi:hypothetical protein
MKMKATQKGFYGDRIIQIGEQFEAEDFKGKWAVPAQEFKPEVIKTPDVLADEAIEGLQGKKKKAVAEPVAKPAKKKAKKTTKKE